MAKQTKQPKQANNEQETAPAKEKLSAASADIKDNLKPQKTIPPFIPDETDKVLLPYIKRRIDDMMNYRKSLGIEKRWQEADEEYVPHELDFGTTRKRFETDQDTGLRSRMVPVGDITQQWRQASSAPTLLAKIQTAISLIIDQMPEADLVALEKKYQATTEIAYALWKRNWQITDAKEKLKLLIFDLMRYGWCAQRTYPRTVKYSKKIKISTDTENPENDKYEDKEITWFDDIDRQPLNVFRTWIDELARPYDQYSTNESYYEMDFSYDSFKTEFGQYSNFKCVQRDSDFPRTDEQRKSNRAQANKEVRTRKDVVTVGFFQSRHKDLYSIYIPKGDIILYKGPLPNDDGYIDITHTLWILRKSDMPYGVSLWEIIRQNKQLYDKMKNMTMDQLVLSIMKFGFFSGTNTAIGDGKIEIVPGQARQLTSSTGKPEINWMEIPGPGEEAWKGIEAVSAMMDDESGISPTLEGDITGKTLGETELAREASLKRLKTPLENVAWLIDQDAYLTLSWMGQKYSIPNVQDFTTAAEMMAFEQENQINRFKLFGTPADDGSIGAPYQAHYYANIGLHLENREGRLEASKDSQFLQIGKDIDPKALKWKGIFKTIPRSIIDNSETMLKASKMEMFNVLVPLFEMPPDIAAPAAQQICELNEEDPKDWLPTSWVQYLATGQLPPPPAAPPGEPGAAPPPPQNGPMAGGPAVPTGAPAGAPTGAPAGPGAPPAPPIQAPPSAAGGPSMQAAAGLTPKVAATVVPRGKISTPRRAVGKGPGSIFTKRL